MKTIKHEEPIIRNRFVDCPQCETRNMKTKKIIQVGRCRKCHESYKVVTVFVKTPATSGQSRRESTSTLPSWETPSDTSLFGKPSETPSTFGGSSFDWTSLDRKESDSTTGQ